MPRVRCPRNTKVLVGGDHVDRLTVNVPGMAVGCMMVIGHDDGTLCGVDITSPVYTDEWHAASVGALQDYCLEEQYHQQMQELPHRDS